MFIIGYDVTMRIILFSMVRHFVGNIPFWSNGILRYLLFYFISVSQRSRPFCLNTSIGLYIFIVFFHSICKRIVCLIKVKLDNIVTSPFVRVPNSWLSHLFQVLVTFLLRDDMLPIILWFLKAFSFVFSHFIGFNDSSNHITVSFRDVLEISYIFLFFIFEVWI